MVPRLEAAQFSGKDFAVLNTYEYYCENISNFDEYFIYIY